jgi:hypothetical protein
MSEVSFFTNCYEGDWRTLLKTNRLKKIIDSCQYPFDFKGLIINNVKHIEEVRYYAEEHKKLGIIDDYFFSNDYSDKALSQFNIKRKSFITDGCDGYWYSIAPLIAIYLCKTSYLLYLTCDCEILAHEINWIDNGKKLLQLDQHFVINPIWTYQPELAKRESVYENENYFKNHGFTDQCFLIKTNSFSQDIYNEHHISSDRYPSYSGHSFERRVNSYMRNHQKYRVVLKKVSYLHIKIADIAPSKKKSFFQQYYPVWSRRIKIKLNQYLKTNIS